MLELDKTTFEPEVLQSEGYTLVDFYGDGCVPCQALMPYVHTETRSNSQLSTLPRQEE